MTARLLSAMTALLAGFIAVLLFDLTLGAGGVLAQETKNCPSGFFWERLSGQCCVQDRATLPSNGKIGYTGNSLCEDGYVGVYERRPTTDGQGPPGCPNYTSFVLLTACLTPEQHAAMEAAGELPEQTAAGPGAAIEGEGAFTGTAGDVAERLYDSGGGPSKGEVAALAAVVFGTGTLILAGTFIAASPLPTSLAGRDAAGPESQPLGRAEKLEALRRQIDKLMEVGNRLSQLSMDIKSATRRTIGDVAVEANEIMGLLADIASLGLPASALLDVASVQYGVQSFLADLHDTPLKDLTESRRDLLANIAFTRGAIMADLENLEAQKDALKTVAPEGRPRVSETAVDGLSDEQLKAEIDEARRQTGELQTELHKNEQRLWDLKVHKNDLDTKVWEMRNYLDSLEPSIAQEVVGRAATPIGVLLGLTAMAASGGVALVLTVGASAASGTSFLSFWEAAGLDERRVMLRQAIEHGAYMQGRLSSQVHTLETQVNEIRSEETLQDGSAVVKGKLQEAENYKAMLREEAGNRGITY